MGRFVRLGLSYSFRTTDIEDPAVNRDGDPENDIPVTFRQAGVVQSTLTPTISYNTLNNSLDPTLGQSLSIGMAWSGGLLGGKVNMPAEKLRAIPNPTARERSECERCLDISVPTANRSSRTLWLS
jgi:hypothetical protein